MQNCGLNSLSSLRRRSAVILTPDRQIDRRILQQADSLERYGWNVTILAMGLDEFATEQDKRVVRIGNALNNGPTNKKEIYTAIYQRLRRVLPKNNVAINTCKKLVGQYLLNWEDFYLKLFLNAAKQFSPDVFIAADLPMLAPASYAAKQGRSKLIYDSHELYSEQGFSKQERDQWIKIEEKYISECDAVITVNKSIATFLETRYDIRDVKVILNAMKGRNNADRETPRLLHSIFKLSPSTRILLLQGTLFPHRNIELLVDAMCHVRNPNVVLVLLGDGPIKPDLLRRVQKQGLAHRVLFHPAVPQSELLRYTEAADGGIIPYHGYCLNNYFCTPNKLFEFISAGLPLLGNDLPEITRIVQLNDIGLTRKIESQAQLANAIDDFFSDTSRLEKWRKNLLKVQQEISWENEEKKFIDIIEGVFR